jgi:hypothetical protein
MNRGPAAMNEKRLTVDSMKQRREVTVEAMERAKRFTAMKKAIRKALKDEELTIPEIALNAGIQQEEVTYWLMTMMKFGEIEAVDDDDVDEYYSYRIKG